MATEKFAYKYFLIAGLLLIPAGCSVEKNTASTRFFQGLTSRYNIYFNGNESFKAGVEKINKGYKDDFSDMLRIFEYSDPSTVSMCSSDMERAVQKASKVITLKSITAKPEVKGNTLPSAKEEEFMNRKEYNEWIDDCYLLMGKARLYKREYELAKSTLSFNINSSPDPLIRNESSIWLARIYSETGNYNEAGRILQGVDSAAAVKSLSAIYFLTLSDLMIKQKRYNEAVEPLKKALGSVTGKRNNYRLTYILAQLYEKTGDDKSAASYFRKVANMNPPYEFEFNARINLAGVFDVTSGDFNSVKSELEKMLKNSKNKEFRDQIYYALGNLMMTQNLKKEAIDYYIKSAESSVYNQTQKARSYLAIADYYNSIPDYVKAGKYYDSTIIFLDTRNPEYNNIRAKSVNLNLLVSQINIIQREDSLQKVAKMTPGERDSFIAALIEKVRRDEASGKTTSNADRYNLGQYYENELRFQNNISQEGKWYFYNQAALTFGRTEFKRRWGDRKLEDNWRRQNKSRATITQGNTGNEENGKPAADTLSAKMDNKKPEFYLANLPLSDSLLKKSDEKIAGAYLESGKIYSEKFLDSGKATESFEKLIARFPGNQSEAEALYHLYLIHKNSDKQKAETYRQRLLEKYPENEFAKILSDPDYYRKKTEEMKEAEILYRDAYELYSTENFEQSLQKIDQAMQRFGKHELAPKFMLLRSYCLARTSDERTFKEELAKIVRTFPGTPEAVRASDLIAFLNKEIPQLKVEEDKQIAAELYTEEPDSQHSFGLVIYNPSFNVNQATFDLISYNIDNYTNRNFRTQGGLVDDKYIMLIVSGFADMKEAMDYYRAFNANQIIRNPSASKMITFIIGSNNLEALNKDKNPERYRLFFAEKYLNEQVKK